MAKGISARRHAQAVFQIALERDELESWRHDLNIIAARLKEPQLVGLLENPKLEFSKKLTLLNHILVGMNPLAMNLISFLVAKGRLRILGDLVTEYESLLDAYQGREHAEVITAVPLGGENEKRLSASLGALVGKEIGLTSQVDPNIIGGLIAKIGDKLIDGSIRTKLQELKTSLIQAGLEVK